MLLFTWGIFDWYDSKTNSILEDAIFPLLLETFIDANFDAAGAIDDCADKCVTRGFDSCTKKDIVNDIFKAKKQCLITFGVRDQ